MLGYVDAPNGESGRCWRRIQDPEKAWRHLIMIGYDTTIAFEVAAGGRL